jgi:hypothetical protein
MRKYNITLGRQSYAKCCLRNIIWCRGHNSCFGQHFANVGCFVLNSTMPAWKNYVIHYYIYTGWMIIVADCPSKKPLSGVLHFMLLILSWSTFNSMMHRISKAARCQARISIWRIAWAKAKPIIGRVECFNDSELKHLPTYTLFKSRWRLSTSLSIAYRRVFR